MLPNRPNLIGPRPGWKEGHLYWMKIRLKDYFPRYFGFPRLLPLLFSSGVLFFFCPWLLTMLQNKLAFPFFSGSLSTVMG